MAVFDFLMNPDNTVLRTTIENEVRAAVFEHTRPNEIEVLSREETQISLERLSKPIRCLSESCMRDISKAIQKEYVILGSIVHNTSVWIIDLQMYDRQRDHVIATTTIRGDSSSEVTKKIKEHVFELLKPLPIQRDDIHQRKEEKYPQKTLDIEKEEKNNIIVKEKMLFQALSFQCRNNRSGFNILGYCHNGIFIGPLHTGAIVYSKIERNFLGAYQISIYNEAKSFIGIGQIGIVNMTTDVHMGIQAGIVNTNIHAYGIQLGIVNISKKIFGAQMGLVHSVNSIYGVQMGLINTAKRVHGLQLGFINTTDFLYGVQLGVLNFSSKNAVPMVVGINIGW